jgi:hypothetical protein
VEALQELYRKMSFSIFNDGLIHKEEFHFALFRSSRKASLFADRVSAQIVLFALFSSDNERGLVSLDRADSYCSSRAGFRPVRPQAERGGRLRGVPAVAQHLPPQGARVGEGSVYVTPTSRRTTPCPFHTTTSRKLTCLT